MRTLRRVAERLVEPFGIDLRTVALFRICFGFILIGDLVTRAHALSAHYTDNGIWPRDAAETALGEFGFSFHLLGGSAAFQVMLFVIAGLLALLVIYCDAPCEFCLKTCQLLRTFLLFESTPVRPAQEHPEIGPLL
jgi:hypothetical protein